MSRWVEDNGSWYYYYSDGEMATGWQKLDGEWYYFYDDGSMARDTMVNGYYVNDDGQWTKDERSRKITDNDGNDFWYYVGPKGKAVTGWNKIGDTFHYYNYPYGSMTRNNTINGFYIDNYGDIVDGTGWIKDEYSGEWYYFSNGEMTYNDTVDGYHLDSHGKMVTGTGWIFVDSWWYYLDGNEEVVTDWLYDQGNWYYLYPQGSMAKGWIQDKGKWYYLNSSGEMVTGWTKYGDSWYYLNDDGAMAHDTTIDGYYLDDMGKWDSNKDDESGDSQGTSNTETNTLMACDTGDRNVDIAFTRWYDTIIPGKKYADDPRYSAISVAAFQNKLLYMSEQGIDVSQLSADELDKLFEDEMDDQANATLAMSGAADMIANNVGNRAVKVAGKAGIISKALNKAKTALAEHIEFIKNGGIVKPTGGKFAPSKVSVAIDTRTGEMYYGYSGKTGFNPSRSEALDEKLQSLIDNTKNLAKNTTDNPYVDRESFELWSVDNCAEINAVDQALKNGAKMEDIFIRTVNFKTGEFADFCDNCKVTFKDFMKATE